MTTQLTHTTPTIVAAHDRLIDRATVAAFLYTSERHVRRLVASGGLPFVRVGGKVRFRLQDVEAYVASHTVLRHLPVATRADPDQPSSAA
jgi:excisionase family DNA binding protein